VSLGVCECGCGQQTALAKRHDSRYGSITGKPNRFLAGHFLLQRSARHPSWLGGRHRTSLGYVLIYQPGHPRANGQGYVMEHLLIAEGVLGYAVPVKAVVHHVNKVKDDNRNENLVVCEDEAYHRLLHVRAAAYEACGNPNARRCYICKQWDDLVHLVTRKKSVHHRQCVTQYMRQWRANRLAYSTEGPSVS